MELKALSFLFLAMLPHISADPNQLNCDALAGKTFSKSVVNDKIYSDRLLFETKAKSKLHCSEQCSSNTDCLAFTFAQTTSSSGLCRGHASTLPLGCANVTSVGSKLYQRYGDAPTAADCNLQQVPVSGVTTLVLVSQWMFLPVAKFITAYCDQDTDQGGWTVSR